MTILDQNYAVLLRRVLVNGFKRPSRVGNTISLPGQSLSTGPLYIEFPIITTRKVYPKGVVGELAAFLAGATMLEQFKAFGCNYWDHNAGQWVRNENLPKEAWEVGCVYGAQWRNWGATHLDQLQVVIDGIKADPNGRRHIMTTWNPEELTEGCLPPCHLLVQFYVYNSTVDAVIYMRSVDLALGLPSDLVLYGVLLMLIAKATGLVPGRLHFQFGDAHIYEAHLDGVQEQLRRHNLTAVPKGQLSAEADIFKFKPEHFSLTSYTPMEPINYVLL